MRNNPDVNIKTGWSIDDIVKPAHMNALTGSIIYDYVITSEMVKNAIPNGSGEIDVDALLGGDKIHGISSGNIHVLINTVLPASTVLLFPDASTGAVSGNVNVHVHTIAPFTAHIGTNGSPYFHFYFHTYGTASAITISAMQAADVCVGSFIMESPLEIPAAHSFTYESALDKIPVAVDTGVVKKSVWLSNSLGSASTGEIRRVSCVTKTNDTINFASNSSEPLDSLVGLSAEAPLDLSEAATVHWITWSRRGYNDIGDPWYVENQYEDLHIDTDTMVDGVVYHIDVQCYCDEHESRVSGGISITKEAQSFTFEYNIDSGIWSSKTVSSPKEQPLPIIANATTCDVAIAYSSGKPSKFTFGAPINMEYSVVWAEAYNYAATPSRTACPIVATPGQIDIDIGVPTGYTGSGTEHIRLASNMGLTADRISHVSHTPRHLDGVLHLVAPTACLYTPSSTEAVQSLAITLYEAAGNSYQTNTDCPAESAAFRGDVYLVKDGANVYVLGY